MGFNLGFKGLIKNFQWINQQCSSAAMALLANNQKVTAACIYTGTNGVSVPH